MIITMMIAGMMPARDIIVKAALLDVTGCCPNLSIIIAK